VLRLRRLLSVTISVRNEITTDPYVKILTIPNSGTELLYLNIVYISEVPEKKRKYAISEKDTPTYSQGN